MTLGSNVTNYIPLWYENLAHVTRRIFPSLPPPPSLTRMRTRKNTAGLRDYRCTYPHIHVWYISTAATVREKTCGETNRPTGRPTITIDIIASFRGYKLLPSLRLRGLIKVQNPGPRLETNCLGAEYRIPYRIGPRTIITHAHRAPKFDGLGHATLSRNLG